jgi:DNA-binding NarL/FixJ family response regulator
MDLTMGAVAVSGRIKVLISDGRKLAREALGALLEKYGDLSIVGEAGDARSAMKLIGALEVDVVIVSLSLPADISRMRGWTRMVRDMARARAKVLVLCLSLSAPETRELFEAGAAGCLTQESASEEMAEAIRAVMAGKRYLSARLTEQVMKGYVNSARPARRLAPKETEVLRRIGQGQSNKEIAFALEMSVRTVETHRRRIMEKLNRHSIAELTQYAVVKGLVALPNHADA